MGCSPPERTCQKVYQVSIFSPPVAGGSPPPEPRSPGRQPIKRSCPEPQRAPEGGWGPKRGCWEPGDDAIEDGLLVEDLPLGGAAQHFSHSGLRVVEHRQEDHAGRHRSCRGGRRGTAALEPPHIPCTALHTRDCVLSGPPPSCPSASGPSGRPDEDEGVGGSCPRSFLDPELHNLARQRPPEEGLLQVAAGPSEPGSPGVANGLASAEKTPCSAPRWPRTGPGRCPAKRKLLPSVEGLATDMGSEDEGPPPARRKRTPPRPAVPASCRSTDAKGAPFWNHLLPAAKVSARLASRPGRTVQYESKGRRLLSALVGREAGPGEGARRRPGTPRERTAIHKEPPAESFPKAEETGCCWHGGRCFWSS